MSEVSISNLSNLYYAPLLLQINKKKKKERKINAMRMLKKFSPKKKDANFFFESLDT